MVAVIEPTRPPQSAERDNKILDDPRFKPGPESPAWAAAMGPENFIYGLVDPRTNDVRYIGKSIRPFERLQNHYNEPPSNCHRSHWLQELKSLGLRPELVIFESVMGEWPWQEAERYWIARGRALGWPLTNNTDGGDGVEGLPPETREKMRRVWVGRKHRPESLEKLKAARALRTTSNETRAKMSASQKGRKITWIGKIAEANQKLTSKQRSEILSRLQAGELGRDLAREFGVHRTTLSKVKMGTYLKAAHAKQDGLFSQSGA